MQQSGVTVTREGGQLVVTRAGAESPAQLYRAAEAKREVLGEQLDRLQERRQELTNELRHQAVSGADKAGLEKRLTDLDTRISAIEGEIAEAERAVAQAAGVPGAVVPPPPPPPRDGPPEEAFVIFAVFLSLSMLLLAVSWARRLWKKANVLVAPVPQVLQERIARIEQSVDAIAIEVERQGEGQRFLTKVLSESPRAIGQGAAQPVEVAERERARG